MLVVEIDSKQKEQEYLRSLKEKIETTGKELESLEEEKIELIKTVRFEEQNEKYEFLSEKNYPIRSYIENESINLERAYKKEDSLITLGCVDDGLRKLGGIIPLPASGLLFLKENDLIEFIKKRKVDVITTHVGCGAALVWAREKYGLHVTQKRADELAMKYIQFIASKAKIQYRHYFREDMARSQKYHAARMVFLNNVQNRFYPSRIKELPSAFSIERFATLNFKKAEKELELVIKIAFGEEGFGERFTEEKPFIIVCCLNENDNFEEIKQEINGVLDKIKLENKIENIKERTKIDYFIAPAK